MAQRTAYNTQDYGNRTDNGLPQSKPDRLRRPSLQSTRYVTFLANVRSLARTAAAALLAARCPRLRLLNLDRLHQSRAKPLNFCQDSRTVQLNQDLLPLASLPLFLFLGLFLGLSGHPAIIGSYNAIRWSSSTQKRMGTHVLMIMIFRHRCARVVGQDAEWPRAQHAGIPHRADDAPAVHVKKELERARVDPLCVWPNPNQTM